MNSEQDKIEEEAYVLSEENSDGLFGPVTYSKDQKHNNNARLE